MYHLWSNLYAVLQIYADVFDYSYLKKYKIKLFF